MNACAAALVLLLDMSGSVELPQWHLQIEGHARAFEAESIGAAIQREGSIAVRAVAFSDTPETLVGWTLLRSASDAQGFAASLREAGARIWPAGATHTAASLTEARQSFETAPCEPERRIVDLVTDGVANDAAALPAERRALGEAGIRLNALFVATARGEQVSQDAGWEDGLDWLRQAVVTADGAALAVQGWGDFQHAIRRKIVWEIAAR